jgi:hypothetical protein
MCEMGPELFDFAVAVSSTTRVWGVDAAGRRRGYTWREGTSESLRARFAFLRRAYRR